MTPQLKLTGITLSQRNLATFLQEWPHVAWIECHTEDFFGEGGFDLHALMRLRERYPISLHGRSLSLGSGDDLNWSYLKNLTDLIQKMDPCLISDHLSWSSHNGQYFHECLPLLLTEESLKHVIERIDQVQNFLQRQMLIENIANEISLTDATYSEAHFLSEVCKHTGCGILLNINNLHVSAKKLLFDPTHYLSHIHLKAVKEIHVADLQEDKNISDLYQYVIELSGIKPTIITSKNHLAHYAHLLNSVSHAETIMRDVYATIKHAS